MFRLAAFILVATLGGLSYGVPVVPKYHPKYFLSPRIVGGQDAEQGDHPHMVALATGTQIFSLVCGAVVISTSCVLTAAHCIDAVVVWPNWELQSSLRGIIGSNEWSSGLNTIEFKSYKTHPEWSSWTIKNDIGILYTSEVIVFSETVSPLPLSYEMIEGGVKGSVAGWGRIEVSGHLPANLQYAEVEILRQKECENQFNNSIFYPLYNHTIEMCTYHSVGVGMCYGDSGSPLVVNGVQVGIVSWGSPCALGMPDVFVRISAFKNFIDGCLTNSE